MSKVLINEVMLGKRCVGFECYSMESQDIVGMTAKQIKDSFAEGKPVLGFKIDSSGELVIDCDFCKNHYELGAVNGVCLDSISMRKPISLHKNYTLNFD